MSSRPEAAIKLPSRSYSIARMILFLLSVCAFSSGVLSQNVPPYLDPKLPVEQRIADLLSRMTLEEKVAQMESAWENRQFFTDPQALFVDEKGAFLPERAAVLLKNGLG